MYSKKVLLFLSLLFLCIIRGNGQNNCSYYGNLCQAEIDTVKLNVYKSILLSKEIKSDEKCHIVIIQPVSLSMNFASQIGFFNIKEEKDSVSVINLRSSLPKSYWIYSIEYKLSNTIQKYELISKLLKIDSLYTPRYLQEDICEDSFDVIKIQEPLDNWMDIYQQNIFKGKASVVIPVIYESFIDKPKYLLYKIELYEGSTKVKSVKTVELE